MSIKDGTDTFTVTPDMEPQAAKFGTVSQQAADPYSVLNYFRNAIRIRNAFPVIACGRTEPLEELSDQDVGAFLRAAEETGGTEEAAEPVLVVFSTSDEERRVDLSAAPDTEGFGQLSAVLTVSEEPVMLESGVLTLPPRGIAVLTRQSH